MCLLSSPSLARGALCGGAQQAEMPPPQAQIFLKEDAILEAIDFSLVLLVMCMDAVVSGLAKRALINTAKVL